MAERTSRRNRGRSWLAGALVALTGVGCTPMDDILGDVFAGRSMRYQPSVGAYENPMLPPANAVPFAAGNFPQSPGTVNVGQPELAEIPAPVTTLQLLQQDPAVMELANPVESSDASLARGEEVYERACTPCHGATGAGDGPVTQVGMPSFSLLTDQAVAYPDGYIYTMIRIGRGGMPPYQHQITHYDRWHVVNYVRQLQASAGGGPPADGDTPADADAAADDQAEEE